MIHYIILNMESYELKTKCHTLIDLIDDEDILEDFYFAMDSYYQKDKRTDIIDDLSDRQLNRLDESIRQAESGQTIPHVAMKKKIQQWLTK